MHAQQQEISNEASKIVEQVEKANGNTSIYENRKFSTWFYKPMFYVWRFSVCEEI
jgi:hypothetical protein